MGKMYCLIRAFLWKDISVRNFRSFILRAPFLSIMILCCARLQAQVPGNATTPTIKLWLRADAGITGTSPVTAWADQGGGQANAVRVETAPDLISNGLNFNPVLRFDNADYLRIPGGILGTNSYSNTWIYLVNRIETISQGAQYWIDELSVGGSFSMHPQFNNNLYMRRGGGLGASGVLTTLDYNIWAFGGSTTTATPSGNREQLYKSGLGIQSSSASRTLTGTGSNFHIGGRGASSNFLGNLAEVIIYTSTPTANEHERIQSYLAIKYGITKGSVDNVGTPALDERDYLASNTSVIWDFSANVGFNSDIVGIGRDDNTALNQRKTQSNSAGTNQYLRVTLDKGGAFGSNLSYLLWGHNGAIGTSADVAGYTARTARIWKVQSTGTPGVVNFSIDLEGSGLDVASTIATDFALLTDADGVFATGASVHTSGATKSGSIISFTNVSLATGDYFTIAGPSLSGPAGVVTGLKIWLKADAGVTGTTPVTAWSDQAGGHADALQVGTAPDLISNGLNFNPVLRFNNSDYLRISGGILQNKLYTDTWIYIVNRSETLTNGPRYWIDELADGGSFSLRAQFNSNLYMTRGAGGGVSSSLIALNYNIWAFGGSVGTGTPSGNSEQFYLDGLGAGSSSTSRTLIGNGSDFHIGGRSTTANFLGDIAELIIYTATPTASEHERIQSYLAIKYGITKKSTDNAATPAVDERDYFASNLAVIWDFSTNAGYNSDIVGIGRDDKSTLSQLKTRSNFVSTNQYLSVTLDKGGVFTNDVSYLLWGHNGAEGISTDVDGFASRTARTWKVQSTGTPGLVNFTIDLEGSGLDVASTVAADFALLKDADGVFATGASVHTTGASKSGSFVSFTNVSFASGDFFTVAGKPLGGPGDVSTGLKLWLKADEGITGASPVTAWADQGGGQADAIIVGTAPDLISSGLNYNPVLRFDNSDYLRIPGGILGTSSYTDTWIYLVKKSDVINNGASYWLDELASDGSFTMNTQFNGNIYVRRSSGAGFISALTTLDHNIWTFGGSTSTSTPSGNREQLYKNGLALSATSTSRTLTGNGSDFHIGGRGASSTLPGEIAEIIIYTSTPSVSEHQRIESYLALKYGITKASTDNLATASVDERDYFASNMTVVWDYSANVGFNSNIIGLGRDDNSALNQKQSQSRDDSLAIGLGNLASSNLANANSFALDRSFLFMSHNGQEMSTTSTPSSEHPPAVTSRIKREVLVTNTNCTEDFFISWKISGARFLDPADMRLLMDVDDDFSDATVLDASDGLVFTMTPTRVEVSGISNAQLPVNGRRFFTLGSVGATPLPITLLDFRASVFESNKVRLAWETGSETNNDYFTLERSHDGSLWEMITTIKGAGNSSDLRKYQYVDGAQEYGTIYYRLKQTDYDGKFAYSKLVNISITSDQNSPLVIYPNPTNGLITLFGSNIEVKSISVFNSAGQDVSNQTAIKQERNPQVSVDLSSLPYGFYFLHTNIGSRKVYKK